MAANALDTIMLLGDSITQYGWEQGGFIQRLAHLYARKLDVINRGLSGYNTEWAIPVFEQCFAKKEAQPYVPKVKLLTIWFGANDACLPNRDQYVSIPRFIENLHTMISMVREPSSDWYSPTTRIILLTPPPVNVAVRAALIAPREMDRTADQTKAYADAVIKAGEEARVPVVDLWTKLWEKAGETEEGLKKYLKDGLHLNAEGYEIVFDQLIEAISKHFPELHYDRLPQVFTHWDTISLENPRASLKSQRVDV
ncbi:hypothetical protein BOTBODRAFT_34645 [Botryobasidium botryosum FD-172 SS1]|uniref:SGNH hydrolase-type esterase domain-containing protein n=1 Tax=Botryobasidium botryosum (strain FD-172 SS1) TaxID=930990 RepID=A0A067MCF3_BOTB1|nr:hypothetical protein BOTBODRAFT_34645 [Botryobasidium botryosum FD-172 SS1]